MRCSSILAFTLLGAALVTGACSSSTSKGTGAGASSSTGGASATSSTGSGSTSTTSSTAGTTGTGGASSAGGAGGAGGASATTGAGGALACEEMCLQNDAAGVAAYGTYTLNECACGSSSAPCASECASTCQDPSTFMKGSPCANCLVGQGANQSPCSMAATTDCNNDQTCSAYTTCLANCG